MGFSSIIGHKLGIKKLKKLLSEETISHSYIFQGLGGIGKFTIAREFAKAILCQRQKDEPCNQCSSCIKANNGNHPDLRVIAGEDKIIKKEDIDKIVEAVKHRPFESDSIIFIINNADRMNKESMNGLLKTLEEPAPYMKIILVTSNPEMLLTTIRSRCQLVKFNPLSEREIEDYLLRTGKLLDREAKIISRLSKGSIGLAIEMASQGEILEIRERLINIIDRLLSGDKSIIALSGDFFEENKEKIDIILNIIIYWFRDLAIYKETRNTNLLINQDRLDLFEKQSLTQFSKIDRIIENIEETRKNIKGYVNYPLSIEIMLLNIWEDK